MPKISIIIPCYNLGKYLDEAVESVLMQDEQDFEIIIVNDGSTDDYTNHLLLNYKKDKTTVYNIKNLGLPSARNFGISKSTSKYIVCLDADNILHPKYLSSCLQTFLSDTDKKIGIVSTWVQNFEKRNHIWHTESYNPIKILLHNTIHDSSMFRREAWEQVTGYSDNMKKGYEDWEFWVRIVSKGWEWFIVQKPYFYYRMRRISMSTGANKIRKELIKLIISNNYDYYVKNINNIILTHDEIVKQIEKKLRKSNRAFNKLIIILLLLGLLLLFLLSK